MCIIVFIPWGSIVSIIYRLKYIITITINTNNLSYKYIQLVEIGKSHDKFVKWFLNLLIPLLGIQ